jgi:FkbM family methyltransferase
MYLEKSRFQIPSGLNYCYFGILMKRYGTVYGGWNLPESIQLDSNSIIYSGGVGEDISFDLLVNTKFNSNIFLIDPTKRALKHYEEVQSYFKNKVSNFTGDIQRDYITNIHNCNPDFSKFTFISKGLWRMKDTMKFYRPTNDKYVSHTLIEKMYSDNYEIVEVDSIKNIMSDMNHTRIDCLKLDIEGSEIAVLKQMLLDNIFPTIICVEFDLILKKVDYNNETDEIISELTRVGYKMIDNNNWNCVFIRILDATGGNIHRPLNE